MLAAGRGGRLLGVCRRCFLLDEVYQRLVLEPGFVEHLAATDPQLLLSLDAALEGLYYVVVAAALERVQEPDRPGDG